MYQALYRAWRPEVFSDVVGQPHITDTLRAQTEKNRLSHAYLFTGSRGTGKTTCAKILARAVNCEAPRHGNPCNECPSCRGIAEGSILDVIEIDAASNSGVDNIRALREDLIYSPVAVKKRVYIIDEVHMLSTGAFNALLKTLEEPPPHVLFILATTETHKVPATIVSRCQRFAFRRIDDADISARLLVISGKEKIQLTAGGAALLARMADGSLRDGISLLDQCVSFSAGQELDEELVSRALGLAGAYEMARWAECMARGDITAALTELDRLYREGRDFSSLLDELSGLLRDLLMAGMLGGYVTGLDKQTLLPLEQLYSRQRLLDALELISDTQTRLSRSKAKRVETELCVIRLCGLGNEKAQPARESAPLQAPPPAVKEPRYTPPPAVTEEPAAAPVAAEEKTEPDTIPIKKPEPEAPKPRPKPESPNPEPADPEPAAITGDGQTSPRWNKLLAAAHDGLTLDMLKSAVPRISGDAVTIEVADPFAKGLLSGTAFIEKAKEFFHGGVSVSLRGQKPAKTPDERLNRLFDNAGDIIISE